MEEQAFKIILVIITALVSFTFGRMDIKLKMRATFKKDRFEKLYQPFVNLYNSTHLACAMEYADLSFEVQEKFIDLLINNMVYADAVTYEYINAFMMVLSGYKTDSESNKDDLNKIFNSISSSISNEYNWMFFWLYGNIFDKVHWLWKKRKFKKYINKSEVKNSFIDVLQ